MEWIKKHADTITILATILGIVGFFWGGFKDVRSEMRAEFKEIHSEFREVYKEIAGVKSDVADLKREISIVKTVLILKNIMPTELARRERIVDCEHGMD